jgi:hypothetical protein
MKTFILLATLFLTTGFSYNSNDCVHGEVDLSDIEIDLTSPKIKVIEPAKIDPKINWVSAKVALKDGTIIKYKTGGCAHHGYDYEFSNIKNFPKKFDKKTIHLIKKQLAKLPVKNSDIPDIIKKISDKNNQISNEGRVLSFELGEYGDANVTIYLIESGFTVSYNFCLLYTSDAADDM